MAAKTLVERSTQGLMEAMFDELDDLRAGKSTPQKASAAARVVSQIIGSAKMQMDFMRFVEGRGDGKKVTALPSMQLVGGSA